MNNLISWSQHKLRSGTTRTTFHSFIRLLLHSVDEIGDLSDQLSTGGKSLHEVVKAKKKIQNEAEQLKAALDEAEGALELEEVW